jgi:threonylcarbamoyladenosine tRNA methylthiotransferase MtaB
VIPERPYKEEPGSGLYTGYSDNYLQLVFPGNEELVGKVCRVRLDEPGSEVCRGTFVRVLDDAPRTRAV